MAAEPMDTDIFGDDAEDELGEEIARADPDEIAQRTRMLENEVKVLRNETARLLHEHQSQKEKIKENNDKIKLNKQLPYLVANVVELLDMNAEEEPEEDGANIDLDAHRTGKCCVLKTSTRQTIFLPVPGLVEPEKLKPADLVGVNKDSYLILEALPAEFDSRVKAMEVDEKPTEEFTDVGGLDTQIQELARAAAHSHAVRRCNAISPRSLTATAAPERTFHYQAHLLSDSNSLCRCCPMLLSYA
uniref:Proteasomal ATPase second OB domain-containing protein n=1 Tax=Chrysotila carterae TaxID=13221 RepID=A0A7S4BN40_CHRCT